MAKPSQMQQLTFIMIGEAAAHLPSTARLKGLLEFAEADQASESYPTVADLVKLDNIGGASARMLLAAVEFAEARDAVNKHRDDREALRKDP